MNKAIFAAGCFWGIQDFYSSIPGVVKTAVGYTGGTSNNPNYEEVCSGTTGHAEAVWIEFDSTIVTFDKLLNEFWSIHDPTTLNRQGPDMGTQYRSAIFYTNNDQKKIAEELKLQMNKEKFNGKIVTEINKFSTFFPAEAYHQNYNKKLKKKYRIS